ncbi:MULTISPECIES: PIG-L deacetylase family protein [Proteiniphilum]|uniref:PIG-L deacetylase family protein n=3 Tax=Dysgonomonadaceae TaxID=2005520 RepID=UPI001EEB49A0|nr:MULTISPECIES: PIG-L family deacetylase [Proteiniphilum]ULB34895.1 PIG-L family deacetylase [Proteiniphilum propionicum]
MKKTSHLILILILGLIAMNMNAEGMKNKEKRVIVICAHPDDAELTTGGTGILLSRSGYKVKLVSLTNGNKGHHEGTKNEIAIRRYNETQEVKKRMNCEYEILNNEDGELEANLKNRMEVIRLIREWKADIVITHPSYDYHPDHRNTSLLVQDAAFLVNVPKILPEVPALTESPLFLYTRGRYADRQKPNPDIVVDITPVVREKAYIIDAHASQIYEWLPWINRSNKIIPDTQEEKIEYILKEYVLKRGEIKEKDRPVVEKWYGSKAKEVKTIEAFEICEFGRSVDDREIRELFPMFPK